MNINQIKEMSRTENREVEFEVGGHKTGLFLTLRPESSKEVKAATRKMESKIRQASMRRKESQIDKAQDEFKTDKRVAHVKTWRWKDGVGEGCPEFSEKELRELLDDPNAGYPLCEFIDAEVQRYEDFLMRPETSSASVSAG